MKPLVNEKFILADRFLYGNLLQTFNQIYVVNFLVYDYYVHNNINCKVHYFDYVGVNHNTVFRKKNQEEIFLKTSDVISSTAIKGRYYVKHDRRVKSDDIIQLGKLLVL
jgi:hypothetical protein